MTFLPLSLSLARWMCVTSFLASLQAAYLRRQIDYKGDLVLGDKSYIPHATSVVGFTHTEHSQHALFCSTDTESRLWCFMSLSPQGTPS